ncbi:MAG: hypothetical protein ACP5TO_04785 [Thermoplasmata archaeon]
MTNDETISVKGVKKDLYEKIKETARESGKTIGEITNEAYKMFVSATSSFIETGEQFIQGIKDSQLLEISNIDNLEISGQEIKNYGKKIGFKNIGTLKIKEITEKDFEDYVAWIMNVKKLEIPKDINKLKILEKSKFIGEITVV